MSQQVKSRNGMAHQPSKTNTVELQSQLRVEDRSLSAFTVPLLLEPQTHPSCGFLIEIPLEPREHPANLIGPAEIGDRIRYGIMIFQAQ